MYSCSEILELPSPSSSSKNIYDHFNEFGATISNSYIEIHQSYLDNLRL